MAVQLSDHFTYRKLFAFVLPPIAMMLLTSVYTMADGLFVCNLGQLVELHGHAGLLVGSIVLVQQTLGSSLIDSLDGHLVSAIGLAAVAFRHGSVKLLQGSLQGRFSRLVLSGLGLVDENTLLSRLNVRQTKHLLQIAVLVLIMGISRPCRYLF